MRRLEYQRWAELLRVICVIRSDISSLKSLHQSQVTLSKRLVIVRESIMTAQDDRLMYMFSENIYVGCNINDVENLKKLK